jgi:hypothetical protein
MPISLPRREPSLGCPVVRVHPLARPGNQSGHGSLILTTL